MSRGFLKNSQMGNKNPSLRNRTRAYLLEQTFIIFDLCLIIYCLSDRRPGRSVLLLNNFLSEQGLGGPCELAIAKARFILAPTVRLQTNKSILIITVRKFLRGYGGTFFKKFPHKRAPHCFFICLKNKSTAAARMAMA